MGHDAKELIKCIELTEAQRRNRYTYGSAEINRRSEEGG